MILTDTSRLESLDGVAKYRRKVILEGEQIFEQALADATGQTAVERRAEIDEVCDRFRERHYKLVMIDDRRAVSP